MSPILRSLISTARVVAVGADTGDDRSVALAVRLAAERGVPGPGAAELRPGSGGSDCAGSAAPADPARPRGDLVWVRWRASVDGSRGVLEVTFSCNMGGRPFGQGVEQRVERGADGRWRAVGRPGGWTS